MNNIKLFLHASISFLFFDASNIAIASTEELQIPFSNCIGYSKTNILIDSPLTDIDGQHQSFLPSSQNSHISVVLFSTSWCCHCPYVADQLWKLSTNVKFPKGKIRFFFVLVGNETDKEVKRHFAKSESSVICKSVSPFCLKNLDAVPCCAVYDHMGNQVFRYDGRMEYNCDKFKNFLMSLIKNIDTNTNKNSICTNNKKNCKMCCVSLVEKNDRLKKDAIRNPGKRRIKHISKKRT